jgi:hypothetical protein
LILKYLITWMDGFLKFKEPLNTGLHPCRCHPSCLHINKFLEQPSSVEVYFFSSEKSFLLTSWQFIYSNQNSEVTRGQKGPHFSIILRPFSGNGYLFGLWKLQPQSWVERLATTRHPPLCRPTFDLLAVSSVRFRSFLFFLFSLHFLGIKLLGGHHQYHSKSGDKAT